MAAGNRQFFFTAHIHCAQASHLCTAMMNEPGEKE
jgi:hypothetical protein